MAQIYLDFWSPLKQDNYNAVAERLASLSGSRSVAEIKRDASGKPRAVNVGNWHFNLSHSADLVSCGYSCAETGIDLEVHRKRDFTAIANIWFHPWELRRVQQEPEAFYPIWTRKEAWLKMMGKSVWELHDSPDMSTDCAQCKSHVLYWQNRVYSLSYCVENQDNEDIELVNLSGIELAAVPD